MGKFLKTTKTNDNFAKVVFFYFIKFLNFEKNQLVAFFQKLMLKKIIIHPDFSLSTKYHDIALLETHDVIKMSDYVRPACLPPSFVTVGSYTPWGPQLGTNCYVVGWGETFSRFFSNCFKKLLNI